MADLIVPPPNRTSPFADMRGRRRLASFCDPLGNLVELAEVLA